MARHNFELHFAYVIAGLVNSPDTMHGAAFAASVSYHVFLRVAVRDRFGTAEPLSRAVTRDT
ncbi:conserved hypothetical protein [Mesorhizobium delmotii]|uniref:Uncharacterized protein n=1 Tax=Mesorhizobium delmotii TaxID=1631247 RepID=A0A2P9AKQ8_9HYPH|nr:conserved hypothetical protein [Mesorhizobium delmotii]